MRIIGGLKSERMKRMRGKRFNHNKKCIFMYLELNFFDPKCQRSKHQSTPIKETEFSQTSQVRDLAAPVIPGVHLCFSPEGVLHPRPTALHHLASLWLISGFGGRVPLEVGIRRFGVVGERSGMHTARAGLRPCNKLGFAVEGDVIRPLVKRDRGGDGEEEGDREEEVEEGDDLWIHPGLWTCSFVLREKNDDVEEEGYWAGALQHSLYLND